MVVSGYLQTPDRFTVEKINPMYPGVWVGSTADVDAVSEKKIKLPQLGIQLRTIRRGHRATRSRAYNFIMCSQLQHELYRVGILSDECCFFPVARMGRRMNRLR